MPWTTRTFGTSSTRSGSSGGSNATAREMRLTPAGASLRTNARRPAIAEPLGRAPPDVRGVSSIPRPSSVR